MGKVQQRRRLHHINVLALLPLALLSLALTAACAPGRSSCDARTGFQPTRPAPAGIPHVGTSGQVTLSTKPGTTGVTTTFGRREWHSEDLLTSTTEPGQATVVPGSPYPMLKVRTASGRVLIFQLVLLGCL